MQLLYVKCEEIMVEDLDQDDVYECFYPLEEGQVRVVGDDGEALFELEAEDLTFVDDIEKVEVPEGYYAHSIGWRTTEFDIKLHDPNHKLKPSDFTWRWYTIGDDYEWQVPALKEEVGELEFISSWDGRYDETLDIEGRPGPDEEEW